jgi:uncharacterized membrane protein
VVYAGFSTRKLERHMAEQTAAVGPVSYSGRLAWAAFALGFGLGGFFDGILLHQVLQWHHLLSGVEQARQDIRILILADGLFHVLMYVITGVGLWLLWRSRQEFSASGADRLLIADALIGFGVWHILDSVLSHWVLGIHRIRMDVDNPLFWDLLWFALFGIVPLAAAWIVRRKRASGRRLLTSPLALAVATVAAGALAALPPRHQTQVVALFRPDIAEQQAFAAIMAVDGRIVGSDASGQLGAVEMPPGSNPNELYRYGAILVSNSLLPLGCLNRTTT